MLVAGFEIDDARVLITVIHERAFNTSTTYSFACLIFHLCREARVLIWNCDTLRGPKGAMNIGLIKNYSNVAHHEEGAGS